MNTFFSVLGSAAGNLALTLGARGGCTSQVALRPAISIY